jgi:signal transduction histidine kinase
MSLAVEQELRSRVNVLNVLALSQMLQTGDLDAFRVQAEAVVAQQFPGSNIILLREDGQQLMNTLLPRGSPLPVRPNLASLHQVFATGRPAVSDLYQGAVGARFVVAIDVPVKRPDGRVAYVLSMNPRLASFTDVINRERVPQSWVVSVFDSQGVFVARNTNAEQVVGQKTTSDLLVRMTQSQEGISRGRSREGVSVLTAFSRMQSFDWWVVIGMPRTEVTGPALYDAVLTLAGGFVLLLISLGLASFVSAQISNPIASLRRLATGDRDGLLDPPATGLRETDEVAQALRTAEEHRRQSADDKERSDRALHEREEKLHQAQKMEAVGQLTGGVAHDFNNLLMVISGNLKILESELTDRPDLLQLAESAARAVNRGTTLTRSLLAFARRQPLNPVRVDLNQMLRDMVTMLVRTLGETIDVEVVGGAGLWKCELDPGQLQNAVLNLAINARDAMPQGGKLTIETSNARLDEEYAAHHAEVKPGQYAVVAVSDSGTGMSPEIIARAFDPFFTTKGIGKGSGLGLSMVYGFVKQSGGHIKIYSEVGQGTTVKLYLPRSYDSALDIPAAPVKPAQGGHETILVVEDDADVRSLTVRLLGTLGYRVIEAGSAAEAMKLIDSTPNITLMLTDVVLPGGTNGRHLADQARAKLPALKIVYMSGYTENAILHHGRLDPGVLLLQKPFRRNELAEKIRAALDRS